MKTKPFITGILLLIIIIISTVIILPKTRRTSPAEGSAEAWENYIEKRIPQLMETQEVPGLIIALIKDGKTVLLKAYGYADIENNIPMTEDTRCRVESISKSVTALGVMKLVEAGLIELDMPLEACLKTWSIPETHFSEEKVTIRHLLNQTSGMPLGTIGVRYDPDEELPPLKEFLKSEAIMFQNPGTSFSYSNAGYNLLELLIEEVTGRTFADYMSEEVLIPLGMNNSSFNWSSRWEPEVPNGYDTRGNAIPVYVYPDKASGGLFSTAADIAAFVSAGMKEDQSFQALYESQTGLSGYYSLIFDGYGFGHFIERLSDDTMVVSHGGQGSGWMTQFYSMPETGDGIVMLSNSQRSWPLFSDILIDWSRWNGHPGVGMGLISQCSVFLRILLVSGFIIILMLVVRTLLSFHRGARQFFLKKRNIRPRQLIQFILSIALTVAVVVVSQMKYFFLSSVFPVETPLLGILIIFGAATLLLLSLLPAKEDDMRV